MWGAELSADRPDRSAQEGLSSRAESIVQLLTSWSRTHRLGIPMRLPNTEQQGANTLFMYLGTIALGEQVD